MIYLGGPTPTTTMLLLLLFRVFLSWLLEKLSDSWLPSAVRPWQVSNGCQMKPSATVQAPNIEVADRNADNVNLFTLVWHISLSLSRCVCVCLSLWFSCSQKSYCNQLLNMDNLIMKVSALDVHLFVYLDELPNSLLIDGALCSKSFVR